MNDNTNEVNPDFEVISNAYNANVDFNEESYRYLIVFGNKYRGWSVTKDQLVKYWRNAIHNSKSKSYGDVSLYYKGECIRYLSNANVNILDKDGRYTYSCTKYSTCNKTGS